MNNVIKRALQKTGLPSVLEPSGLDMEMGYALMVYQSSRFVVVNVVGVWFRIVRVLILLLKYT